MAETHPYAALSDEALIALAHAGDAEAEDWLCEKYKNFVRARARTYFLVGADREDLVQEGMIGLYKAIRDYDPGKISSFSAFAEICITRQLITAIKTATRQKHIPLNSYVSLNKPIGEDGAERSLIDMLSAAEVSDPEETVIGRESFQAMAKKIEELLSRFERETLLYYLDGRSYSEIAALTGRSTKAVDNALQRVKRKFEAQAEG